MRTMELSLELKKNRENKQMCCFGHDELDARAMIVYAGLNECQGVTNVAYDICIELNSLADCVSTILRVRFQ